MNVILLLTPGIIAAVYYCRLRNIPYKSIEFLIWTIIYVFLINLFVINVMYLRGHKNVQTNEMFTILGNAARFGDLGLIAAFAFPNIHFFFHNYLRGKKNDQ